VVSCWVVSLAWAAVLLARTAEAREEEELPLAEGAEDAGGEA
jgi:hypothetical protein